MLDFILSTLDVFPPIVATIVMVVIFFVFCWFALQVCEAVTDAFNEEF